MMVDYLPIVFPVVYLLIGFYFGIKAAPSLEKYMKLQELRLIKDRGNPEVYKNKRRVMYAAIGAIVLFWPIFAAIVIPLSFKSARDRIGQ